MEKFKNLYGCFLGLAVLEIRKNLKNFLVEEFIFSSLLWNLEISQNSQENICARVSFLIKLRPKACNFIKKETVTQAFLWILRNF